MESSDSPLSVSTTVTPFHSDDDQISEPDENTKERDRSSQLTQLSPEDLLHASNPNIVLTNPVILSHLRRIHSRATQRQDESPIEEEKKEWKVQLQMKVDAYNKQSVKGAFRVTLNEDLTYSGLLSFHYKGDTGKISRLMSLTDKDTVKDILPILRQKFEVPETIKTTVRQNINGDEILLDSDDRPLEIAVNASSSVTFNLVAGSDRTAEVIRNLQSGSFTPLQRKKLMEKFNIDDDMISSTSSDNARRTSQSSTSESTSKCNSLEGSPTTSERRKANKTIIHSSNGRPQPKRDETFKTSSSSLKDLERQLNGNTMKSERSPDIQTATPKKKGLNTKMKRPQILNFSSARRGRDQTMSASARKLFSSLRKTARVRSASRDRERQHSPTKASNGTVENKQEVARKEELSSDVNLPGILKIFGDAVSPGANYKSVLATRQSNARELVKTALERYGVSRSNAKKYVLCEVVGRLREDKVVVPKKKDERKANESRVEYSVKVTHQNNETSEVGKKSILDESFTEDYVRPLNDHEKPLILQSFWRPLEGYARRFELRRRSEVLDNVKHEKDTETRDVNAQAKRLILQKTKLSRTQSSLNIKVPGNDDASSSSEEEDERSLKREKDHGSKITNEFAGENNNGITLPTPREFADVDKAHENTNQNGFPVPFLITLQGEDGVSSGPGQEKGGNLIHYLESKVSVIGRSQQEPTADGEPVIESASEISIKLSGSEIKSHHCVIYRRTRQAANDEESKSEQSAWLVTLHPVSPDCNISVNGSAVATDKEVKNGDLIAIGKRYIFMLKDPSSKVNLSSATCFSTGAALTNVNSIGGISSDGSAFTPVKKRYVDTEISYRIDYEDHVLNVIFAAANNIAMSSSSREQTDNYDRELAPARFLCHCIEHACFNLAMEQKQNLLFVIATNLQTILLDATGSVSLQDDAKIKNPAEGINYILPKLEAVVFWMSNSLEIFSYLQTDLVDRIQSRVNKEMELSEVDKNLLSEAAGFRVSDDILAVLEEVVMYAFQQLVYYLTKTLYGALPTVLNSNPFAETGDDIRDGQTRGTGHVIAIYDAAIGLTRKYGVHPAIESQLFAYLFFFTSVSLFNTLMEDESPPKYYRWDKGVQIQGNLEEIECWANDNGFQEQATEFLTKFSTLTNLLATPKAHIIQNTWSNFRRDFPQLHPAQLRQVLDNYNLGPRVRKRPGEWLPDSSDIEESTEEENILESYDNHPPLMLPTDGTQLCLSERPQQNWYMEMREVILAVGQGADLGYGISHQSWIDVQESQDDSVGEREQPDGREITSVDSSLSRKNASSSISSSSSSSMPDKILQSSEPHKPSSATKQISLTHDDIVNAVKLSERSPSPSSNSLSSAVSEATSGTSHTDLHFSGDILPPNGHIHLNTNNGSHPVPAPRVMTTPTPSPRHVKAEESGHRSDTTSDADSINFSTASPVTSDKRSPDKTRSTRKKSKKVPADFTIRDFRSDPSLSINSLLLQQQKEQRQRHQGRYNNTDETNTSICSDDGVVSSTDSFVNVNGNITSNMNRMEPVTDLRVLPVNQTQTKYSEIANHRDRQRSISSSSENEGPQMLPNEVFIVDVKKGRKGLGLGLVDGMFTSLQVPGVFVRSLVPDGPSVKHVHMKHQEVIKCWLQEGRLLLGDRILAVNGTSLISMNYTDAMAELRQAGDRMRFLVGRSGPEIAMKITSSSC